MVIKKRMENKIYNTGSQLRTLADERGVVYKALTKAQLIEKLQLPSDTKPKLQALADERGIVYKTLNLPELAEKLQVTYIPNPKLTDDEKAKRQRERRRVYYQNNKDKLYAANERWRKANPHKKHEYNVRYFEKQRARISFLIKIGVQIPNEYYGKVDHKIGWDRQMLAKDLAKYWVE